MSLLPFFLVLGVFSGVYWCSFNVFLKLAASLFTTVMNIKPYIMPYRFIQLLFSSSLQIRADQNLTLGTVGELMLESLSFGYCFTPTDTEAY
jgi:hypothetical protein